MDKGSFHALRGSTNSRRSRQLSSSPSGNLYLVPHSSTASLKIGRPDFQHNCVQPSLLRVTCTNHLHTENTTRSALNCPGTRGRGAAEIFTIRATKPRIGAGSRSKLHTPYYRVEVSLVLAWAPLLAFMDVSTARIGRPSATCSSESG